MAKKNSTGGFSPYGKGDIHNPYFTSETTFDGGKHAIDSPHGSIFDPGGFNSGNVLDSRLNGRGAKGFGKKGGK